MSTSQERYFYYLQDGIRIFIATLLVRKLLRPQHRRRQYSPTKKCLFRRRALLYLSARRIPVFMRQKTTYRAKQSAACNNPETNHDQWNSKWNKADLITETGKIRNFGSSQVQSYLLFYIVNKINVQNIACMSFITSASSTTILRLP